MFSGSWFPGVTIIPDLMTSPLLLYHFLTNPFEDFPPWPQSSPSAFVYGMDGSYRVSVYACLMWDFIVK